MSRPIQIRALTKSEAQKLTDNAKFNRLRPVLCKNCSNDRDFVRKIFWIGGVAKAEQNSDRVQYLIAYHLKEKHSVGSVFFKTHRNTFYVDSAECKRCSSTVIEFDIELSPDVLVEISRLTGRSPEKLRSEMKAFSKSDSPGGS
jgi:hypothetical protein